VIKMGFYSAKFTYYLEIPAKNKKDAEKKHDEIMWYILKYIKEKIGKNYDLGRIYVKDCETGRFRGSV